MEIQLSGHPLHTRMQTVALRRDKEGAFVADATHLDLRKRGFVPVGSDLQPAGIIHQMSASSSFDLDGRVLRGLRTEMAVPAFEPSELSRGESCRDISGDHPELDPLVIDAEAASRIGRSMSMARRGGGAHICSL